jgi:hypothetical protein
MPAAAIHEIPVIAVLPEPPAEGRSYLNALGVTVEIVLEAPLTSVDAAATPTLLVVDTKGRIAKAWVGKLGPERENQVIASLQ